LALNCPSLPQFPQSAKFNEFLLVGVPVADVSCFPRA
jgi:hypothetical protein